MTRTVVLDASAVVEQLVHGEFAVTTPQDTLLVAPTLLPYEVANVIRKLWTSRSLPEQRERELIDLLRRLPVMFWPWEAVAERVWELRHNLTSADASYVALAELTGATLITKDRKLAAAPGIRCPVEVLP